MRDIDIDFANYCLCSNRKIAACITRYVISIQMYIDISIAKFHQSMKMKTKREVVYRHKVISFDNLKMYIYINTTAVCLFLGIHHGHLFSFCLYYYRNVNNVQMTLFRNPIHKATDGEGCSSNLHTSFNFFWYTLITH